MNFTENVKEILSAYEADNAGVKGNLAKILMHGKLAGTGKMVILPVDQGFEHGPARSYAMNADAYDPHYHYQLAIDSGCNAYAAPLGALEAGADTFAGQIPTILKVNSANSLYNGAHDYDQAITGTVSDALRLGCSAIGFTIYPGSENMFDMYEEISEMIAEAKDCGIASVIWAYVRGGDIDKKGETAMDTIAYGAHMACLLGAHIVKVKLPSDYLYDPKAKEAFEKNGIKTDTQADRVAEVVRSCFNGRRMVVFSGGDKKGADAVFDDARAIRDGGGNGSIIGRNCFQRPREESLAMLDKVMAIYAGKE